eukprot:2564557-Alexandrium_andersonii.AAC.1
MARRTQTQRCGAQLRHTHFCSQLSPEACSARSLKTKPRHAPAPRVPSTRASEHARAQHAKPSTQPARNRHASWRPE